MIYCDHAATVPLSAVALQAMLPWMCEPVGNASSAHRLGVKARQAVEEARARIARLVEADPEGIYFTSGATEANNMVVNMLAAYGLKSVSPIEHHSILTPARRLGFRVLPYKEFYDPIGSMMLVNNETGIEYVWEAGQVMHSDVTQAVPYFSLRELLKELKVRYATASAHKFGGPTGVGFLVDYGSGTGWDVNIAPFLLGGDQERGKRAGTLNVAGIVGMAAALQQTCDTYEERERQRRALEEEFFQTLRDYGVEYVPTVSVSERLCGFLSVAFPAAPSGEALMHRLDLMGICVSTGAACDSRETKISHVLQALGISEQLATRTLRITFGVCNKPGDGVAVANAIAEALK